LLLGHRRLSLRFLRSVLAQKVAFPATSFTARSTVCSGAASDASLVADCCSTGAAFAVDFFFATFFATFFAFVAFLAFLAVVFLAAFLAVVRYAVRFVAGARAARSRSNSTACSAVIDSGSVPRGTDALTVPSVTYGP
jgi:hypothetical protein